MAPKSGWESYELVRFGRGQDERQLKGTTDLDLNAVAPLVLYALPAASSTACTTRLQAVAEDQVGALQHQRSVRWHSHVLTLKQTVN